MDFLIKINLHVNARIQEAQKGKEDYQKQKGVALDKEDTWHSCLRCLFTTAKI